MRSGRRDFQDQNACCRIPAFAEQHLGEWQGLNRAAFFASRPIAVGSYWFAPIDDPAPGGESFLDLYNRVRGAIERINTDSRKDVIAVGHWRHHQGGDRACAWRSAEKGLAFTIDNCSVTRLDHLASATHSGWRVADGQSAAMDRRRLA